MSKGASNGYTGFILIGVILLFPLLYGINVVSQHVELGWLVILAILVIFGIKIAFSQMSSYSFHDDMHKDIENIEKHMHYK